MRHYPGVSNPHELARAVATESTALRIIERPYDHPDARVLVKRLYDEQVECYGYADPIEADPELYRPPHGLFLVGYSRGRAACCGGFRSHGAETVEIKKMYAVPELRGLGLGMAILSRLERRAAAAGARRVILETGVRNTAALALYRRAGYRPTARYVPGRDPAINRAFVKDLVGHPRHSAGGKRPRRLGGELPGLD